MADGATAPAPTPAAPIGGPVAAAATAPRAILTPALDLLLVGGLWILIGLPLLVGGVPEGLTGPATATALLWLTAIINVPHFMASYRLLYGSAEQVRRHPWAAWGVPALLLVWCVVAAARAAGPEGDPTMVVLLQAVAGIYLAWHYTGQAWGMMAVFAHVDGFMWSARERGLLRLGLRLLLAWHVAWFLRVTGSVPQGTHAGVRAAALSATEAAKGLAGIVDGLALLSVPLGLAAFGLLWRRTGRPPTARAVAPWVAVHLWYLALWRTPPRPELVAIVLGWIQIGHALQYLAFPARVELNRQAALGRGRLAVYMLVYAVLLVVVGQAVFAVLPRWVLSKPAGALLGIDAAAAGLVLTSLVVAAVNVHHYFTDGCVWKVSNPDVRKELLAHLPRPAPAPTAPAPVAPTAPAPVAPPAPAA